LIFSSHRGKREGSVGTSPLPIHGTRWEWLESCHLIPSSPASKSPSAGSTKMLVPGNPTRRRFVLRGETSRFGPRLLLGGRGVSGIGCSHTVVRQEWLIHDTWVGDWDRCREWQLTKSFGGYRVRGWCGESRFLGPLCRCSCTGFSFRRSCTGFGGRCSCMGS